jgi:hypothetical protein
MGAAITNSDLDGNGTSNLADFQTFLNNLHTAPAQPTRIENFRRGELTGDANVNFNDWAVFRTAYNAANGAGAFEALLAQVPEPSTCGIALVLISIVLGWMRRRATGIALAFIVPCLALCLSDSASALDIKVDIDSMRTSGTATGGPIATQSGFTSWDLTNVATEGTTITLEGVTFELFGFNAADQSRIRLTGTTPNGGGGTFNDMLADFVFNEGADGRAIGLRITNLPVGSYTMQSWHHDFGIGTPEVTQVEIRNQGQPADPSQIVIPATPWSNSPLQYPLQITTAGQVREVIFREASAGNRARFSGFTLSDVPPPLPIELTLQVNTTTGAVRILNEQEVGFDVSYYELRSPSGALNTTGWASLDDAEGGDPVGTGWDEATVNSANLLSEVNLTSMTSFSPGNMATLGNAFTPGAMQDLAFFYAGPTETSLRAGNIDYVTGPSGILGDYNANGTVDAADYVVWRKTNGTQTTLPNDETPGSVTTADYAVWRTNFGRTALGAGLGSASAVPEPHALLLGLLAAMSAIWLRQR